MVSFSFDDASDNEFILFNANNQTNIIGRIIQKPYNSPTELLVSIYTRIPDSVHLIGSTSTFGTTEVVPTNQQIIISSTDITDFCFIFDIQTHIRSKVHIQGMSNAFIINVSDLMTHIPFRPGFSIHRIIFNGLNKY